MPNLNLKNFAKIKDSDFSIKDITVLAGKPGSGKSYIMKFLYAYVEAMSSILDGTYKMHYTLMDNDNFDQTILRFFKYESSENDIKNSDAIKKYIDVNDYIKAFELINKDIDKNNKNSIDIFTKILKDLSEKQKKSLEDSDNEKFNFIFRNVLASIFGDINQINDNFTFSDAKTLIIYSNNKFSIENLTFDENNKGALFVETPLILEFQKFLPVEKFQVPYHIDSLLQELNKNDFTFTSDDTNEFMHQFRASTSQIIQGNIFKGNQGFSFETHDGKSYNIVNASSGIKSIGLLQYLVSNKALKKGSTLFWEEPEVHLHPTWQLKMIDLFVELMNAGIKIVFSTHSPFMADKLNAKAQKENFSDRVSFNLLSEEEGIVSNTILDTQNWNLLQSELLDSLEEIMWEYL